MKTQAIIRLAVLVILVLNQGLVTMGWNPLPFSEDQVYEGVSIVATTIAALYAWWKNNNVTEASQKAQKYLDKLKEGDN